MQDAPEVDKTVCGSKSDLRCTETRSGSVYERHAYMHAAKQWIGTVCEPPNQSEPVSMHACATVHVHVH